MIYGFGIFTALLIVFQLYIGFAVIGWVGDNMVVEKEKSPGPYWFSITIQLLIFVGFGIVYFLS